MWKPKSQIPAYLEVFDIAGLVQGAHLGQGLGNEFLSNIQSVDGVYHMVRAFKDEDVVHVEGEVDPIRDMKIINNELVQKDLSFITK
jgi:obg-like ATPase 1